MKCMLAAALQGAVTGQQNCHRIGLDLQHLDREDAGHRNPKRSNLGRKCKHVGAFKRRHRSRGFRHGGITRSVTVMLI